LRRRSGVGGKYAGDRERREVLLDDGCADRRKQEIVSATQDMDGRRKMLRKEESLQRAIKQASEEPADRQTDSQVVVCPSPKERATKSVRKERGLRMLRRSTYEAAEGIAVNCTPAKVARGGVGILANARPSSNPKWLDGKL
jgi:hypothetical protein